MKYLTKRKRNGFTVIEMVATIGIISLIALGLSSYVTQGVRLLNFTTQKIKAQENVRTAINAIISEMREMLQADNGSYPLISANDFSIEFYSNVDSDPEREKIKYELIDGSLYRWVVDSDNGQPAQYPIFTDNDRTFVTDDITNTSSIFKYFDNTYNGETSPLSSPFSLNEVSFILVTLEIDQNLNEPPEPFTIETGVSLRNLKYKYEN